MAIWGKWIWTGFSAIPLMAQAQVDLTVLDRDMVGPRAQVLVLGTMHLSGMPQEFKPSALDATLDRLAAFKPDIITIEREPGEECDLAARHPIKFGLKYCASTEAAQAATGLDVPAALVEVNKTLKAWPIQPTPAQRRRLAALFLASNDTASAYVQWLQLPLAERRAGDTFDASLVDLLEKTVQRNNEDYLIAAPLAARLGLPRVYPIDNHSGDLMDVPDVKAFGRSIEAAWAAGNAALKAREKGENGMRTASDLLPLYRYLNTQEGLRVYAESNILPALRAKSPEGYPQMWVAGWEIRNLRMVANIRETFRERPGAKVLSIVGVSHKPWFDSWLGQLQRVDIVDVQKALE